MAITKKQLLIEKKILDIRVQALQNELDMVYSVYDFLDEVMKETVLLRNERDLAKERALHYEAEYDRLVKKVNEMQWRNHWAKTGEPVPAGEPVSAGETVSDSYPENETHPPSVNDMPVLPASGETPPVIPPGHAATDSAT